MFIVLPYLVILYVALYWKARDAWHLFRKRPRKQTFSFKIGDLWMAGLCVTPVFILCAKGIEAELLNSSPSVSEILGSFLLILIVVPCQCIGIFDRMVTEEIGPTVGRSDSLVSAATVLVGALFGLTMIYFCFWSWIARFLQLLGDQIPERQRSHKRSERHRTQYEKRYAHRAGRKLN